MFGRRSLAVIATMCIGLGTCVASADELAQQSGAATTTQDDEATRDAAASRQRAKQLYEDGLAAYRAGRYSDAVDKLLEADQVMPNAAFSYNIALVYETMGDHRSALRWLRQFLRQRDKPSSDKTSDDAATREKVRKFEAELQAKGLQQVTILSKPSGAALRIDGQAVGIAPFTTEIIPGRHQATLQLDGFEPAQKTFELRPDRSMDIEIDLVPVKIEASAKKASSEPANASFPASAASASGSTLMNSPVTPPPEPDRRRAGVRPWTWISLGAGAALLGGATIFEYRRKNAEDHAKAASQADYQSEWDKIETAQTTARVLAVAGSAVVATGLVLLTIDLTRSAPIKTATLGRCSHDGLCIGVGGQL